MPYNTTKQGVLFKGLSKKAVQTVRKVAGRET